REETNAELQEKLVANVRSIEQLTADAEEAIRTKTELEGRVEQLENELESMNTELLGARTRIEELEGALATAEAGLDERRAEAHELSKQFDDEIEEQAGRIAQLNDTLDSERKALEAARAEIGELEATKAAAEQLNADFASKLESRDARRDELKSRLADMDVAAQRSADEIKSYVERLARADAQLERRDEQIIAKQAALDEALGKIDSMTAALEEKTASISDLENELRAQQETSAALQREVERIDALYTTVQALGTRISEKLSSEAQQRKSGASQEGRKGDVKPTTRLIVTYKGNEAIRFPLYKSDMTIGRSADSDIQLRWQSISRQHARISNDGETTYIEDLGSKNGVYVNSEPVTSHELRDGDTVGIGAVQFRYVDLSELAGASGTRH
ncbi:MAG: FHA domain-containing protein, partial [Gammaproteobacteria bacterium]